MKRTYRSAAAATGFTAALALATGASAQIVQSPPAGGEQPINQATVSKLDKPNAGAGPAQFPTNAKTKLPQAPASFIQEMLNQANFGAPVGGSGARGVASQFQSQVGNQPSPQAYGSSLSPYTTARVAVTTLGNSSSSTLTPVTSYPYRAAGKLVFNEGASQYVCSASLISRSLLVTAAHCVYNFGVGFYSNWVFYPAYANGSTYSSYTAYGAMVLTPYANGKDTCDPKAKGVVCNNDIAVIALNSNGGYAGDALGTYGYGTGGYSYVKTKILGNKVVGQITQLGYPVAFDNGWQMERTDAPGVYYAKGKLLNTLLPSAQTGGSSGGPWLVNFGTPPTITGAASLGTAAAPNVVVGVTSWGYTATGTNQQGASWFGKNKEFPGSYTRGDGNIGALVTSACSTWSWACY